MIKLRFLGDKVFKWFNKNKNIKNETDNKKKSNYEINDDGDIKIKLSERSRFGYMLYNQVSISKSSIISHSENNIVSKNYVNSYNYSYESCTGDFPNCMKAIEDKSSLIEYKETEIRTYEYFLEEKVWKLTATDKIKKEKVSERTPLDMFEKEFDSKYKLIETVDEFNEYSSSILDCDTWCRKKLYNKMKELGLGDGFINQFADLVGNDLDKYHAMIDLAKEVSDKDTLMYLYTYKFSQ